MYKVSLDLSTGLGKAARRRAMRRVAILLQEQTLDRIEESGDDEITFAPLRFKRSDGSQDRPLWRNGSHLHTSVTSGVADDGAWVGSSMKGANALQYGTRGKSAEGVGQGKLKTIKPRHAKALFIPLTRRAENSVRIGGKVGAVRKAPKKGKKKNEFTDLKKGVDFLFVSKVDLPPRPFLRVSKANLAEIVAAFEGTL